MFIVRFIKYDQPSSRMDIGYFSTKEKAIEFCEKDFLRIQPHNLTKLLPANPEKFRWNERFEYDSYYGDYQCAYELVEIELDKF